MKRKTKKAVITLEVTLIDATVEDLARRLAKGTSIIPLRYKWPAVHGVILVDQVVGAAEVQPVTAPKKGK